MIAAVYPTGIFLYPGQVLYAFRERFDVLFPLLFVLVMITAAISSRPMIFDSKGRELRSRELLPELPSNDALGGLVQRPDNLFRSHQFGSDEQIWGEAMCRVKP